MTERTRAADDFGTIRTRLAELQAMAVPMCPRRSNMTLHDCLRSMTPCGEECEHRSDWIGIEKDG